MFAARGVHVISADEVARRLMQPGEAVYRGIVEHFGPGVVLPDGQLDRKKLAELAFQRGRLDELNRIVHPPVIAEQERWADEIFAREPDAIVMVESALVFEAGASGSVPEWHKRFDRIVLVTAPDELKVQRFVQRMGAGRGEAELRKIAEDARARLAAQIPDTEKAALCDFVIDNSGMLENTERQVDEVFSQLWRL
jgi:dephospho-CoA kinase